MPRIPAQPPVIRIRLEDSLGNPLANSVYSFSWREVKGGHAASQTDKDGILTEPIPAGAKTALLTLADPTWSVVVEVVAYRAAPDLGGTAARLSNLQMMALPPSVEPSAADPQAVAQAVQRYKTLKAIDMTAALDQVAPVLMTEHDTI